ncbi:MAG: AAA family ATPase, partial [Acidobacteria bacterium]|nr:AAA family ATPase [Acidobacteriota bacterium]MBU1475510.1 AAA family ATPase [Acidobacteriota bacterium]
QILDNTLLPMLATFENNLENRRKFFLQSLDSHDWSKISGLVENPRTRIRKLAAHKLRASRVYAHASDEERKRKLTIKQKELAARQDLFKNLDAVLALLQRLQDKAALEKCIVQLKTRPISDKSKELASKAVSKELKKALDQEFKALDVNHIRTILKGRTERGRMLYRLVLDLPTVARIEQILSEGEQRAIAIGSFLAELSLADHSGGIVLDDPVSSLDHWRRKKVAKRLVQEASRRQVIVFTHDTSFLGQLRDEIDESGTPHSIMFLE